MNPTLQTAIVSAVVAIITAVISAFTTIAVKKADIDVKKAELDEASTTAENTQQKTGKLLKEVEEAKQQLTGTNPNWILARVEPGWSVYGAPYSDPSYTKDQLGFVHLRGLAKGGAQGQKNPLMILPDAYRPDHQMEIVVACSGPRACQIVIETDGRVWFELWNPGWVSVDAVTFAAAAPTPKG